MRNLSLIALFVVAPSLAAAQTSVNGSAETRTSADVNAGRTHASATAEANTAAAIIADHSRPKQDSTQNRVSDRARAIHGLSAQGRTRAEAVFQRGQQDSVPERPLVSAMLEVQAKGATEAQILTAQERALARLKASKEAMVRGGRSHPNDEEVQRGANVLARGATTVQLEGLVQRCPSDRSLVAAFETVTELSGRGVPVSTAVAEVGAQLDARASDEAIRSLDTSFAADAATNASIHPTGIDAGAGAETSTGAAVGQMGGGATATGGLAGALSGSLGR